MEMVAPTLSSLNWPAQYFVGDRVGGASGIVLVRDRLQMRLRGGLFLFSDGLSVDDLIDRTLLRDEVEVFATTMAAIDSSHESKGCEGW